MKEKNVTDRLTFLAEQFDIFEIDGDGSPLETKIKSLSEDGYVVKLIQTNTDVIALLGTKLNEKDRELKKVSVSLNVFSNMIAADPTENKMYLQWMLNVFTRFIKVNDAENLASAIRFVTEDLPQANTYLILFEDNKRKKKFKDLCLSSYVLKNLTDPTNINQYKSLSHLFDAVDPFIEREPSAIERTMIRFVESGQALIPVKDRNFTLFIPKTTAANVIFDNFANWCTAKKDNGMFKRYTQENKKPNGKNSDIYIVINNKFFSGESNEMYQIHFESKQIKDRKNSGNVNIFETVLSKSEAIDAFFYEELMGMAKQYRGGVYQNCYLDTLIKFGHTESLFEMFSVETPSIAIEGKEVPKLPDLTRFKNLDELTILNSNLSCLHPSIGSLKKLEIISLTNNNLKELPKEIGDLKNLVFINITGNKITEIPDEIANLDKSNGGNLYRIAVKKEEIGDKNYSKLKRLLPETLID
jgi:Leucine-rich repeat (LRR) protein